MTQANIIQAKTSGTNNILNADVLAQSKRLLSTKGWVHLRGFAMDMTIFSQFVASFCDKLTFDPAREYSNDSVQKVDAGTDAIGLHIENGNTPFVPDIVGFYCKKSALTGAQTTVCDGAEVFAQMTEAQRKTFAQQITVKRTLPEHLWKSYAANEHPAINHIDEVDASHLEQILSIVPNHRGTVNADGSLDYELDLFAVIESEFNAVPAFANAILGPSFNYQPPTYTFADGSQLSEQDKDELRQLAEKYTHEVNWQDGDVVLIDNKRVMHGRREITDASRRELYIGMGSLAA